MSLDVGQRKWNAKTATAFREKWLAAVQSSETFDEWVQGLSAATGIPAGTIAASLPAQNYRDFQANAAQYMEKALRKIEAAGSNQKWSRNFRRAFGG